MVRAMVFVAGLVFVLVGPRVYAGPQLASDLAAGGRWTPADDLAVREFKCTRWYFLVSTCGVDYLHRRDPARVGGTLNYLVFGSWSGERTRLLRSLDNPERVGTTLGLEHMARRLVSFGVFLLLGLAVLIGLWRRVVGLPRLAIDVPSTTQDAAPAVPTGMRAFGQRKSAPAS